jgi:uncharacterized protein YjiS (DUF1127 family)
MNHLFQPGALRQWLARIIRRLHAASHYAASRREFDRLDLAALRDLGVGPSEFPSYWAEASGLAERTRRRIHVQHGERA